MLARLGVLLEGQRFGREMHDAFEFPPEMAEAVDTVRRRHVFALAADMPRL